MVGSGLAAEDHDFFRLAEALRELGALRVKHGSYEAAFGPKPEAPSQLLDGLPSFAEAVDRNASERDARPLRDPERAELDELREKVARAEELGILL